MIGLEYFFYNIQVLIKLWCKQIRLGMVTCNRFQSHFTKISQYYFFRIILFYIDRKNTHFFAGSWIEKNTMLSKIQNKIIISAL